MDLTESDISEIVTLKRRGFVIPGVPERIGDVTWGRNFCHHCGCGLCLKVGCGFVSQVLIVMTTEFDCIKRRL